jgi:CRP/FNR family cyclic AMP-dependent transcriptional regulator
MNENTAATTRDALGPGDSQDLGVLVAGHPFLRGFDQPHVQALLELAGLVQVPAGEFIFRHNEPSHALHLLTEGDVTLEMARTGRMPLVLESLHQGDTLGWSWLFPPHLWHLDALAITEVTAITIDAAGLRDRMTADPALGAIVSWRIGELLVDRLSHARDQLSKGDAT